MSLLYDTNMQNYIQADIKLKGKEEWISDLLAQSLADLGFESFEQIESDDAQLLRGYIRQDAFDRDAFEAIFSEELYSEHIESHKTEEIVTKDWNEEWEKNYYKPAIIVEGKVAVRASFHEPVEGVEHEIIIDPKMAFGTGNHGTTKGMMQLMSQLYWQNAEVIDMGCGSGILGIYGMKLGARKCYSIDFDEWSVVNAKENAQVNNVELEVIHGDASALKKVPRADILLANINRNIIIRDLQYYVERVKSGGYIMLSGFYTDDLSEIMSALAQFNLTMDGFVENNDWIALKAYPHLP